MALQSAKLDSLELPVGYVPLSPLYNTYVSFCIDAINSFVPLFGTKSLFMHPMGHPINKVEVCALVSEKIVKEKYIKLTLEDGTGSIQCLQERTNSDTKNVNDCSIMVHELTVDSVRKAMEGQEMKVKKTMPAKGLLQFLVKESNPNFDEVDLGDIVIVQGALRTSKWDSSVMLRCEKFKQISDDRDVLDQWLEWLRETMIVDEDLYSQRCFLPQEIARKMEKTVKIHNATDELVQKLTMTFSVSLLSSQSMYSQFHGYEALDFPPVLQVFEEILSQSKPSDEKEYLLSAADTREIKFSSIIKVLQNFVIDGQLFKRKGFYHARVTKIDQLDAIYYVTISCKKLVDIVTSKGEGQHNLDTFKGLVEASEYYFLADSKHFHAIVTCILNRAVKEPP